jgi:major inositol transporter-like SP family MFS transporter
VRTWRVAAIAGFTGVLFGYDISSTNDAIAFMVKRFGLSSLDKGLVVSALLLGALAGALGAGKLADTWGRRPSVILAGLAAAVGEPLIAVQRREALRDREIAEGREPR